MLQFIGGSTDLIDTDEASLVATHGLDALTLLSTVVYAVLGVLLLMLFSWVVNKVFKLDLRRELLEDQNPGLGVAFAGTAIAIAIIVATTAGGGERCR